jgi:hypothetical protein
MNKPGLYIYPRAEKQFFEVKILKFFDAAPGSRDEKKSGSRDEKKSGSRMEKIRIR